MFPPIDPDAPRWNAQGGVSKATHKLRPARKPADEAGLYMPGLECLLCRLRYSKADILSGRYQLSTNICSLCYAKMQAAPCSQSCFGKVTRVIMPGGERVFGYHPKAVECGELCPDRKICQKIVRHHTPLSVLQKSGIVKFVDL